MKNKNKGRGAYPWQFEAVKDRPKKDRDPVVSVYQSSVYGTRYYAGKVRGQSVYAVAKGDK